MTVINEKTLTKKFEKGIKSVENIQKLRIVY